MSDRTCGAADRRAPVEFRCQPSHARAPTSTLSSAAEAQITARHSRFPGGARPARRPIAASSLDGRFPPRSVSARRSPALPGLAAAHRWVTPATRPGVPGPCSNASKASQPARGPCATTSTRPSSRLRAQPMRPSSSARARVHHRKPTPWTRPRTHAVTLRLLRRRLRQPCQCVETTRASKRRAMLDGCAGSGEKGFGHCAATISRSCPSAAAAASWRAWSPVAVAPAILLAGCGNADHKVTQDNRPDAAGEHRGRAVGRRRCPIESDRLQRSGDSRPTGERGLSARTSASATTAPARLAPAS